MILENTALNAVPSCNGRGVDVLVGTPGRLTKFAEASVVYLREVSYLVIDEADQMLTDGFEPQVRLCRQLQHPPTNKPAH